MTIYEQPSLFETTEQDQSFDEMPTAIKQRVQYGDVWSMGNHRLLCGDSTRQEEVQRLMQGEQFTLCFTSPPYTDQREYKIGSFDWHTLMCGAFAQMIAHGETDCHILVNLGLSHKKRQVDMYWLEWLVYCKSIGWPVFGWYVWDKGSVIFRENDGRLLMNHEFLFHFNQKRKSANKWIECSEIGKRERGGLRRSNGIREKIWSPDKVGQSTRVPSSVIKIVKECSSTISSRNHPAIFPIALPEFIMQTWSQPGDIVYEPFCGSGTSIIAGERLKRRVRAIEIEPTYCDLAIARWEQATGQKAELVERLAHHLRSE